MLTLRGKVVTEGALHCQRQAAQQVIEPGGNYALVLKATRARGGMMCRCCRTTDTATPLAQDTQISEGYGRIATRIANVSADVAWLQAAHHGPGLSAVGKALAIGQQDGMIREPRRCCLLSGARAAARLNCIVRGRWGIANGRHWAPDAAGNEAQARN